MSVCIGSVQRRAIPLPAKIVHLLVSDLQSYLEAAAASEEGSECSEDEGEMETLLVAEDGQWEEGPEEDPDLMADSLLQLDMQVWPPSVCCPHSVCVWVCSSGTAGEKPAGSLTTGIIVICVGVPEAKRTSHTQLLWHIMHIVV